MAVDASTVYLLANQSGFGVEICKIALEQSKNDAEAASKLLKRWTGSKYSADKNIEYGAACSYFESEHNAAVALSVTCTDEIFAKSKKFYGLVGQIASETVMWGTPYVAANEIEELEKENKFKIDIHSVKFDRTNPLCLLTTYTHKDKIAVVLETEVQNQQAFSNLQFRLFSFDLAMHIAAFAPLAVSKETIPNTVRQGMLKRIEADLVKENKEMKYWLVATQGKLNKWMEQRSLLNQIFIKSDKETVEEILKKVSTKIGSEVTIRRFERIAIGS